MHAIRQLAQLGGWKVYHPFLSVKSPPGFPDLVLVRAGDPVIYAELKLGGKHPTPAQAAWLDALRQAQGCEVYLWRPHDWPRIEARLLRHRGSEPRPYPCVEERLHAD
jgi:hypothetical protein